MGSSLTGSCFGPAGGVFIYLFDLTFIVLFFFITS